MSTITIAVVSHGLLVLPESSRETFCLASEIHSDYYSHHVCSKVLHLQFFTPSDWPYSWNRWRGMRLAHSWVRLCRATTLASSCLRCLVESCTKRKARWLSWGS